MDAQTRSEELPSQTISQRIERLVRSRTGGMIKELRVDVDQDGVIISGRTTTYYNKQLATHAALDAVEDVALTNDIEVR